ncbi:MAG: cell division FtsZ family protein, partial [Alistipes sp.]|nr:cell division FtsZ family protein [Alistipes sp.]
MNELSMPKQSNSIITVIGVGGAGGNALNYMWKMGIKDVNFLACNTDQRALDNLDIPKENKIVMGPGLGAGNDPEEGRRLATESIDLIKQHLEANDTKMVFIAAGMGGGTGTGASPVIAKLTHDMDILTVANVTSPLLWEGPTRYDQAQRGIEELRKYVDSLLVIDNESIIEQFGNLPMSKAFSKADDILASATKGIAEIITV